MIGLSSRLRFTALSLGLLAFVVSCSQPVAPPAFKKGDSANAEAGDEESETGGDGEGEGEDTSGEDGSDAGDNEGGEDSGEVENPISTKPEVPPTEPVKEDPKVPTPKENVASLDGFRWELPCERMDGVELCVSNLKVDQTKTIAGKAADVYEVELQFRGVVEPMKYKDGKREDDRFYIGGSANDPTYNIYSIEVSNPKQIYYLNWAENTGHDTFAINYTAKIKMNGGATVRLIGNGQNDKMIANFKNAVASGVEKLPGDNKGQFIQMNVVNAILAP